MSNEDLCRALMVADSEATVVSILKSAGYWDDPLSWRYLGDNENNFGSIGNQQSRAISALIEKLVNGVDARLINECLKSGIDPESSAAPRNMREAVAMFFDGWEGHPKSLSAEAGLVRHWEGDKLRAHADLLTLTATGYRPRQGSGRPSLSIADAGEGQTPAAFPDTFLSLQKSNKLRIPFVQGKFNMGATGALQFCSPEHRLQLIISRRNPDLLVARDVTDLEWGFTIVRREAPSAGSRSSVFTYLAPRDIREGRDGQVLSFPSDTWPLFPVVDQSGRDAYRREATHGSLVKLYEYSWEGTHSNIVLSGGGLRSRVDFGMPELALPMRLYECRPGFRGHTGSFSTNVLGVVSRLDRDRMNKLEEGTPIPHILRIDGREIRLRTYVLKSSASEYRSGSDAIVFTINGQTHAAQHMRFFRRASVGLSQLADSMILVVDCTHIDGYLREDLFMNSRDRVRNIPLARRIEKKIEQFLRTDKRLRELKNRRRLEEIEKKLDEARPLANALSDLVRQTPSLSRILRGGHVIPSPFPVGGGHQGKAAGRFKGKRYPTYFRFRRKKEGEIIERDSRLGSITRLRLETDAEDSYFDRDVDQGIYEVETRSQDDEAWVPLLDLSLNGPVDGIANLSFELPDDVVVGDYIGVRIRIADPSRVDEFVLRATLRVVPPAQGNGGGGKPTRDRNRNHGKGKGDRDSRVALPNIIPVPRKDWEKHDFDELSALKVVGQGNDSNGEQQFDYYVNIDNKYLLTAQKNPGRVVETLRAQFTYSLVLFSMALLVKERSKYVDQNGTPFNDEDMEAVVGEVSRRLAPFILPTLEALGTIAE